MNRIEIAANSRIDEMAALSGPSRDRVLVACTWAYAAGAVAAGLAVGFGAAFGITHGYQSQTDIDDLSPARTTDMSVADLLRAREDTLAA
ncbi:MAG TPA: hypothetical protein VJT49_18960 [Amycolatopsis sp.]|uniref:hypothetical protein n=1 Tax=Amycolatopsis sp. TaxID=37632 RepID=UPI002B496425|nr:hypothetical protein [Amycolatopsis sp.]HKS47147.1 hypothetical protein [Amycolatopsis sp.]